MQRIDGTPVFSPTDLVAFLACEHLTALERAALHGLVRRPHHSVNRVADGAGLPRRESARAVRRVPAPGGDLRVSGQEPIKPGGVRLASCEEPDPDG